MLKPLLLAAILTLSLATGYHAASERNDVAGHCPADRTDERGCLH